jgi:hypothetical protein
MPQPFTQDVRLTRAEVATLLGQGQAPFSNAFRAAVLARNPQMGNGTSVYYFNDKYVNPLALAGPDAVTYYTSSFLHAQAPDQWASPNGADPSGNPIFTARGVVADFTGADPTFTNALQAVFTRAQMTAIAQVTIQPDIATPGPGWAVTDYETATALGLTPVAIENAAGEFVKPTPDTLTAAVGGMVASPDGRLSPDPNASASGAYPLTMVEYAMTPATPLYDDACAARTHAQDMLKDWLRYVTGAGQAALPAGYVALPAGLREQAVASIDQIGATPAACVVNGPGQPPGTAPPAAPAAPAPTAAASTARPTRSAASIDDGLGDLEAFAGERTASAEALEAASASAEDAEPAVPPLFGIVAVSRALSPAALLLIVALTSAAALVTSGRPLRPRRRPPRATG